MKAQDFLNGRVCRFDQNLSWQANKIYRHIVYQNLRAERQGRTWQGHTANHETVAYIATNERMTQDQVMDALAELQARNLIEADWQYGGVFLRVLTPAEITAKAASYAKKAEQFEQLKQEPKPQQKPQQKPQSMPNKTDHAVAEPRIYIATKADDDSDDGLDWASLDKLDCLPA